jgi:hypothetical protein
VDDGGHGVKPWSFGRPGRASSSPELAARAPVRAPPTHRGMLRRSRGEEVGFAAADDDLARPSSTTTVTAVKAAPTLAAVAANRKPLAASRASGKGPERSGMGTKRQSMTKSFTAQVLSRARSSRKSTRAVEESLLVVHVRALEGRVACREKSAWDRKTGGDNGTGRQLVKKALRLDFWRTLTHLHRWNPLCAG